MKGNRDVINQLNQVLYHHLTAINQSFLHSRMFNDWGIEQLGSAEYKESIRQMKQMTPSRFLDELPQDELEWLGRKKKLAGNVDPKLQAQHYLDNLRALIKR